MKYIFICLLLIQSIYLYGEIENPGISISGDIYSKYKPAASTFEFGMGGVEIGISSFVDTFAEAKVTVHFHGLSISEAGHVHLDGEDHNHEMQVGDIIELEEAWLKLNTLPGGFQFGGWSVIID